MGYANSARVAYQCTLHKGSICKHLAKLTIVVFMLSASDPVWFFWWQMWLVLSTVCHWYQCDDVLVLYCMSLVSVQCDVLVF